MIRNPDSSESAAVTPVLRVFPKQIRSTHNTIQNHPPFPRKVTALQNGVSGTCASVRLDSLISLAFKTSRSSMVSYIEGGQVFVNGKLITSNGYEPKDGDIISVRGKGRFIFDGVSHQTKKGRCSVRIMRYV